MRENSTGRNRGACLRSLLVVAGLGLTAGLGLAAPGTASANDLRPALAFAAPSVIGEVVLPVQYYRRIYRTYRVRRYYYRYYR
ncbi:hypothetical protein VQH23_23355 [Pararoseomonas sp. SCSIO 73927]|uniref:hypothetical protein n=1 Tax=Pararoseomonas sp. SCSIO 73927 TaxID=3114537 RepID=UPI0030CAAA8E